ncbi:glycosyltransferase family 4 protein [Foetidibacter luteolus]|uniref:glycosyltransferase family 4 protein n=1 Tax=Foetidibacter luteolus TaxID=2608880 RepID=UPI00129B0C43|nr:glycosyltransferase family 4 protein [Foetidibacter luteolus]
MRLLFINSLYYPNHIGGAEVSVQTLAETLAGQGHEVFVLSLGSKEYSTSHNGVNCYFIRTSNLYSITEAKQQHGWKKLVWHLLDSFNFLYRRKIKSLLAQIQPDVVNSNNIQGFSPFIWRVIKQQGLPLVHTMRDYYLMCYRTTLFKNNSNCNGLCTMCNLTYQLKKGFFKYPDAFIAISRFTAQQHIAYKVINNKPIQVIANSVLPQQQVTANQPGDNIVFGFIGKVIPEKGIEYLLEEIRSLPAGSNYQLLIAGAYEPAYKKYLDEQYGVADNIQFAGKMNAAHFYNQVNVVIVPSLWNEPFGRVPVEAANFNRPVCIANVGGLQDLYDSSCMWQFSMVKGSLAGILAAIIGQPAQVQEKTAGCKTYAQKFNPAYTAEQFTRFVTEIINLQKKRHG